METGPKPEDPKDQYNSEYVQLYLERTLEAPYSAIKNRMLAKVADTLGATSVLDLGSNVHGSIKTEGSLRFQLEKKGITYTGMDLSPNYFDKQFIRERGLAEEKIYPQIQGIVGDILHIPIKSDSTELVTCNDVLEHTSSPEQALVYI